MTVRHLGVLGLAEELGVTRHAVHKWRARHPHGSTHPFPAPDVEVDGAPGWLPDRLEEIVRWRDGLPGRGAGGGRPSTLRLEYYAEAAARGLDDEEAAHTLAAFGNSFPEMSEQEIMAWLVRSWRE